MSLDELGIVETFIENFLERYTRPITHSAIAQPVRSTIAQPVQSAIAPLHKQCDRPACAKHNCPACAKRDRPVSLSPHNPKSPIQNLKSCIPFPRRELYTPEWFLFGVETDARSQPIPEAVHIESEALVCLSWCGLGVARSADVGCSNVGNTGSHCPGSCL